MISKKETYKRAKQLKVLLLLLFFLSHTSEAQFLETKINVYLGFNTGNFFGDNMVEDNDFRMPALFPNYNSSYGFVFGCTYSFSSLFLTGINISRNWNSNWDFAGHNEYRDSKSTTLFVSPLLRFQTPVNDIGLFNRMRFFLEIAPGVGHMKLALKQPFIFVSSNDPKLNSPVEESCAFYGYKATVGANIIINTSLGFFMGYSIQKKYIDGYLFQDKSFSSGNIEFGFFYRLFEDKRFFY